MWLTAYLQLKIFSILVDERTSTLVLEVEEENQAQIIGKNGQNLRLMTQMIGWSFKVFNREQFKKYQQTSLEEKYENLVQDFRSQKMRFKGLKITRLII
ncbi:MAG: hypothetical protein CM15mP12_1280 [Gammaproteobacteria bacterium]|nr:MAG: hypothetical protein CM15mP12_1280 [Gammaproteobacteria bacterium]